MKVEDYENLNLNGLADIYLKPANATANNVKVKKENVVKLENLKETNPFLEYLNLKPIKNVQCAFEYRHLTLPKALHEVNPLCCARYKTSENNSIPIAT